MPPGSATDLGNLHHSQGFAFWKHVERHSETYGDASISLDYLRALPDWHVLEYDSTVLDPYQVCIVARPQ